MARQNPKTTDASLRQTSDAAESSRRRDRRLRRLRVGAAHEREELTERLEELADPLRDRLQGPVRKVNRWWRWVTTLKPYRVWIQFSHNDGNLRTAGMSYQSLFAVFAALWVAFSVAGYWLTSNPNLFNELVQIINDAVPGLIATSGDDGVISKEALLSLATTFGWTSIIAFVGLLWTAVAWLYYTRQAVRAMFDLGRDERNYALQKITDFGLAVVFGVILIFSAAVSVLTTEAISVLLGLFGVSPTSFWPTLLGTVIGFAVSIALNFFTLAAMYRVLSRVVIPWRSLTVGSLLGAISLSGLGALGGLLIGGATKNPLLATFAVFIGLLIWFNLICRMILLAAAWIAVGMKERGLDPRRRTPQQIAYEHAVAERSARLLVAQATVAEAERRRASARGIGKWFARYRVRDARAELARIESEPLPQPPRKRSWWLQTSDDRPDTVSGGSNAVGSAPGGPDARGSDRGASAGRPSSRGRRVGGAD